MDRIQQIYSALIVRGRRSNPTYAEVSRDNRDELINRADPIYGVRI
ncbi:MAG: hypothetical protein Q7K37_05335 [Dehalococcoidia bacterium]|nr:hypothetical protein [Dehalococcoidia bacterium]